MQIANYNGAGALPFALDKHNNAYFLLSQEAKGKGKNLWCDFGGKRDHGEHNPLITAARECWEESCDILGTQKYIRGQLTQKHSFTFSHPKAGNYVMAVYQKSLKDDGLPAQFQKNVSKTKNTHKKEKSRVAWVRVNDVFNAVKPGAQNQLTINGHKSTLRGCFAGCIRQNEQALRAIIKQANSKPQVPAKPVANSKAAALQTIKSKMISKFGCQFAFIKTVKEKTGTTSILFGFKHDSKIEKKMSKKLSSLTIHASKQDGTVRYVKLGKVRCQDLFGKQAGAQHYKDVG